MQMTRRPPRGLPRSPPRRSAGGPQARGDLRPAPAGLGRHSRPCPRAAWPLEEGNWGGLTSRRGTAWFSRRAVLLHLTTLVVVPGCLALGWWQLHRALSGNTSAGRTPSSGRSSLLTASTCGGGSFTSSRRSSRRRRRHSREPVLDRRPDRHEQDEERTRSSRLQPLPCPAQRNGRTEATLRGSWTRPRNPLSSAIGHGLRRRSRPPCLVLVGVPLQYAAASRRSSRSSGRSTVLVHRLPRDGGRSRP